MTKHVLLHTIWLLAALVACSQPKPAATSDALAATTPLLPAEYAMPQVATGTSFDEPGPHYAVATAHPLATRAAEDALKAGGSAVDGLVAASFMLTVVQPQSTGIGGGGFALVYEKPAATAESPPATPSTAEREPRFYVSPGQLIEGEIKKPTSLAELKSPVGAFDFRETAPAATRREDYLGPDGRAIPQRSRHHGLAVGVPGYVAGLWTLHQKYGKRPWSSLVQPAAQVARRGFPIGGELAGAIGYVKDVLNPAARALYLPGGQPLRPGDVLRMPKLGRTLEIIAERGRAGFYEGAVALDIAATVQAAGGKLTVADLAAYEVRQPEPLFGVLEHRTGSQGHRVSWRTWTMPQPSAGGAQVLAMLEPFSRGLVDAEAYQPELPHILAESMRRTFLLRLAYSGDTDAPARHLGDVYPDAARQTLWQTLDLGRATPTPTLLDFATKSGHGNTSHVSIADGHGMVVAATHTVNLYLGSGIVDTESGVLLNNEMDDFTFDLQSSNAFGLAGSQANLVRPGARPVSSMTPVLVEADCAESGNRRAGKCLMALGTPGGTRIPTTVGQVLLRHLYLGASLQQAVAAPRVHHQAFPDVAQVENLPGGDELAAELTAKGHQVERRGPWCNVQGITRLRSDRWTAVSDPRGEGGAAAR